MCRFGVCADNKHLSCEQLLTIPIPFFTHRCLRATRCLPRVHLYVCVWCMYMCRFVVCADNKHISCEQVLTQYLSLPTGVFGRQDVCLGCTCMCVSGVCTCVDLLCVQTTNTYLVKQSTGHTHTGHTDRENTPDTGTHAHERIQSEQRPNKCWPNPFLYPQVSSADKMSAARRARRLKG